MGVGEVVSVVAFVLDQQGGHGVTHVQARAQRQRHGRQAWRQCRRHCGGERERNIAENPWKLLNKLQKGPEAPFRDLIMAPKHFYKIHKNS